MTDRWARAEERYRQREADRRYRRDDSAWGRDGRAPGQDDEWDDYDDDTTVIPRYTDDEPLYDGPPMYAAADDYDEEPSEPASPPRAQRPARGQAKAAAKGRGGGQRPPRGKGKRSRVASRKAAERKRKRRTMLIVGGVLAIVLVAAVAFAVKKLITQFEPPADYAGPAGPPVVVQVHPGDTATQIAQEMRDKDVVASTGAFYEAAVRNSGMNAVQPGFYQIPSQSPAEDAVAALLTPGSRVGNVVISEGRQLHDQHDVNTGAPTEGIYTKIAAASCVGAEGAKKCVTYEELSAAGAGTDLAALGVPSWAQEEVRAAPDRVRQLDGLIAAGTLDFDPSGSAQEILRQLITTSAARYEETGLLTSGANNGLTPYETLIAASLVEREALPQDMPKVARVIVNRLEVEQPLQFDSTVNYALDTTEVATTDADRAKRTPWNTYAMPGLPANPIASPSIAALKAMENPEPGNWLYFVTIDMKGTTLFTDSYSQHLRNIEKAMESGILNSGR
ncbi:endolytic transglycosylase MltG [Nocardia puris]|uniref:endolytic transglycosylase MltG n=1 Tax=Nocardia puris TaxID=208602 RepID=UPI002E1B40FA